MQDEKRRQLTADEMAKLPVHNFRGYTAVLKSMDGYFLAMSTISNDMDGLGNTPMEALRDFENKVKVHLRIISKKNPALNVIKKLSGIEYANEVQRQTKKLA